MKRQNQLYDDDNGKVHTNNSSSKLRYVNETANYQELPPVTVGPVSYTAGNVQGISMTLGNSSSPNFIKTTESSIKPLKITIGSSHKFNSMALDVFIDSSFQSNGFTITHQIDEKTIEGFTYVVNSDFQVEQIVFVKSSPNNYIFDMTYQKVTIDEKPLLLSIAAVGSYYALGPAALPIIDYGLKKAFGN